MKGQSSFDRFFDRVDLLGEIPPGWPLVEILGNQRVLIENQNGVCCYDPCNIKIKVRRGLISVTGEKLELRQMTRNQVVITGTIYDVALTDWR